MLCQIGVVAFRERVMQCAIDATIDEDFVDEGTTIRIADMDHGISGRLENLFV